MRKVSFQKRFNCTEDEYFYAMLEQMRLQGSVTINVSQLPDEIRPRLADAVKVGRLTQEPIGKRWVNLRETATTPTTAISNMPIPIDKKAVDACGEQQ